VVGEGFVAQLWRHPVKSLQGERLDAVTVDSRGVIGDRAWGVRDIASGTLLSAKRDPRLLLASAAVRGEGVVVSTPPSAAATGRAADAALSELAGRPVRIEVAPAVGPAFVDEAPLHLLAVSSLGTWDVRRFRPNVLLDTALELDDMIGERLAIGAVVVEVRKRTRRCAMTTAEQAGLPKDVGVLRTLAREQDLCQGVYARVVTSGRIAVDDAIRVT
jgi:MOSC domain-containing protein